MVSLASLFCLPIPNLLGIPNRLFSQLCPSVTSPSSAISVSVPCSCFLLSLSNSIFFFFLSSSRNISYASSMKSAPLGHLLLICARIGFFPLRMISILFLFNGIFLIFIRIPYDFFPSSSSFFPCFFSFSMLKSRWSKICTAHLKFNSIKNVEHSPEFSEAFSGIRIEKLDWNSIFLIIYKIRSAENEIKQTLILPIFSFKFLIFMIAIILKKTHDVWCDILPRSIPNYRNFSK